MGQGIGSNRWTNYPEGQVEKKVETGSPHRRVAALFGLVFCLSLLASVIVALAIGFFAIKSGSVRSYTSEEVVAKIKDFDAKHPGARIYLNDDYFHYGINRMHIEAAPAEDAKVN